MTENLSTFCRVFATQLSKWRSTFPRDKFEDNYFFENTVFVQHFRTKSVKFLAIWQKSLYRNVKTAFYVPIGALREEQFFLENLCIFPIIFGHWMRNFRLFVENFSDGCQNCVVHVHGEDFRGNRFFWENYKYTYCFPTMSENVPAFW